MIWLELVGFQVCLERNNMWTLIALEAGWAFEGPQWGVDNQYQQCSWDVIAKEGRETPRARSAKCLIREVFWLLPYGGWCLKIVLTSVMWSKPCDKSSVPRCLEISHLFECILWWRWRESLSVLVMIWQNRFYDQVICNLIQRLQNQQLVVLFFIPGS